MTNAMATNAMATNAMLTDVVRAAGTAGETRSALPYSPVTFGIIALIVFVALLGLTWSFRGTSNRHR